MLVLHCTTRQMISNLTRLYRVVQGTREAWKHEANKRGLSLASLILQAVSEFLENHPIVENPQKND